MIVVGYVRNGKIELPPEYRNLQENTPVKVDIPKEAETRTALHPEVEKLVQSLNETLGRGYAYRPTEKSDQELFTEALEDSEKYGL